MESLLRQLRQYGQDGQNGQDGKVGKNNEIGRQMFVRICVSIMF